MAQKIPPRGIAENYKMSTSSKDSSRGIYTEVDYTRSDGTLYLKSFLSNLVGNFYTKLTLQYYDDAGKNITYTEYWQISYDNDGNVVAEVPTSS